MLLSITEKCRMGCSHCMDDARPDCDKFMTKEMFEKAIEFNYKYDKTLTITGGEPTEHPQFWEFMKILAERMTSSQVCTIATNGMNLSDDDISKVKKLRKYKGEILFQVSSIPPYYPIQINLNQMIFRRSEFYVSRRLEKLEPRGRAANHFEWNFNAIAPQCFNLRSFMRTTKDFSESINGLRNSLKFCTPQIAYDGSLKVGESTLCPVVAHIEDSEQEIVRKICSFRCSECNHLLLKLPALYRQAIGEE